MLELSALPPLGTQRLTADPTAFAHGCINSASWFLLEYDGLDHAVALIDDTAGPLRLEVVSLRALLEQRITVGSTSAALRFVWDKTFTPKPLSELIPICQRRIRHFPRPITGKAQPDPIKASQSLGELVAANRWLQR